MKNLLFIIIAVAIGLLLQSYKPITSPGKEPKTETATTDFCDGWEDGYCEGWKDVKGQLAICPITPICPIPEIGQNSYRGGYNRGFKAGMKAANKN